MIIPWRKWSSAFTIFCLILYRSKTHLFPISFCRLIDKRLPANALAIRRRRILFIYAVIHKPDKNSSIKLIYLHQGCEDTQDLLEHTDQCIALTVVQDDFLTGGQDLQKIILHLHDSLAAIHDGATLKVKIQASIIQICCAYRGYLIIADKGFGMVKAPGVFVNLDTCRD